jgi:hypothetical protein
VRPRVADAVRKACAYALSIALTLLVFRVFSRLAAGVETWRDPAIYAAVVLAGLGVAWVRAAKRVRAGAPKPEAPPQEGQ